MALILALVAAVAFVGAALILQSALGTSRTVHHLSVAISAGILLGVAVGDLVPEAFELADGLRASFSVAAGFLALYLVEALTRGHTHHHEPHGHAHGHGDADAACVPRHPVLPFLLGLALHNLADGVIIGASHEVSEAAAASAALGIVVHQLPVGLSFAAVLVASGIGVARMRRDALLVALVIPLGALVVFLAPELTDGTLGLLVGAAAGALLYIATGHLLPEVHSEERRPGIALAFTTALIATIAFIGALHDEAHGDGGDAEHATGQEHADEDEHAAEEAGTDEERHP